MVEADFSTQMNHQAPLEPEVCVAYLEGEGEDAQLVVIGRSINIHAHMAILQEALGWENIRYEEAFSGGQFGIKATMTSEGIAGAAALHFKRPVRYIPSLAESMLTTSKRHPFDYEGQARRRQGRQVDRLLANDFIVDNGAYMIIGHYVIIPAPCRCSPVPTTFPTSMPWPSWSTPITPPGGAARGAGPPQVTFALESAMDMLAEKMGIDPLEFRQDELPRTGAERVHRQRVEQWPFPELCDAIRPHYERAKKEAAAFKDGPIKRGVGIGAHSFGIGEPGDAARVAVELDPDDGLTIYAAVADPGEGNDSMLTQIAAHLLGLPLDKIRLFTRDTDQTTAMGPAAGSRMTYMAGGALVDAIEQLKAGHGRSRANNLRRA